MAATKKSGSAGGRKSGTKSQPSRSRKQTGKTTRSTAEAKKSTSKAGAGKGRSKQSSSASQNAAAGASAPIAEFDRPYLLRACMRLVAMILYGIIGYVVLVVLFFLAAIQFAIDFVSGSPNSEIREFMSRLSAYLAEILDYLSFRRGVEDFPFPHPNARFPEPPKGDS